LAFPAFPAFPALPALPALSESSAKRWTQPPRTDIPITLFRVSASAKMSAKLEIHRKFSILAWARSAHIWIDNREVIAIANGKTATVDVAPGKHVIATKLGMTSGRPSTIEFAEGQTTWLACRIKMAFRTPHLFSIAKMDLG
jgi:hypothetical protein